jgi:hypothetical protein
MEVSKRLEIKANIMSMTDLKKLLEMHKESAVETSRVCECEEYHYWVEIYTAERIQDLRELLTSVSDKMRDKALTGETTYTITYTPFEYNLAVQIAITRGCFYECIGENKIKYFHPSEMMMS